MKRALLICLSLVLALVGWSAVGAEDGFYVIPSMKVVPKTGKTATYGTRDDGALQKGVASPSPRFTDNGNGTVTNNLTKLIWMQNASSFVSGRTWAQALSEANLLQSGSIPGLFQPSGSILGLPTIWKHSWPFPAICQHRWSFPAVWQHLWPFLAMCQHFWQFPAI